MRRLPSLLILFWILPAGAQTPDTAEFFEKKVRPLFATHCAACHSSRLRTAGLDLTSPEAVVEPGQSGALVVKGDPAASLLIKVLDYSGRIKMPPQGKLPVPAIADIESWIRAGAAVPISGPVSAVRPKNAGADFSEDEKRFWAFQKPVAVSLPRVNDESWIKTPVDRFILAKLEARSLKPSPPADPATLLRRVTFDLTGLPPTEAEIDDFLADPSPRAFERAVDRLLASPRYGEQWGRHWLDVARYADSTGNDEDHRYPYAWRYRDYVVAAFNEDTPFDQFLREQIAGDLLPGPQPGQPNARGIVATGFLALGPKAVAQQDKKKMLTDIYDEQIDVVSKGVLGLSLACARCHDHKFDPLLTKDYYSWMNIFANTKNFQKPESHVSGLLYTPLSSDAEYQRFLAGRERVDQKRGEIADLFEDHGMAYSSALGSRMADYMLAAREAMAGRANAEAVAQAKGLKPDIVSKWMSFLGAGAAQRPYLGDWYRATDANAPKTAAAYQQQYEAKLAEWTRAMQGTRQARRSRNLTMPVKIDADEDPFFFAVHYEGPHSLSGKARESALATEQREALAKLRAELERIEKDAPGEPPMACAVAEGSEGGIVAGKVYIRGDYNSLGEDAPKGVPAILAHVEAPAFAAGSGRLDLARWLTRPDHPLTARVFVNRVWYWHFGEGIVRTPDNFGKMGERPTHPELLDYLAQEFVKSGWSVKALHRMIVLSSAYRMSSMTSEAAAAVDPENKAFSRFPRRRLAVEELRDGLLALDGSLDLTMGGTMQTGFGTDGENSNGRLSLKPETVRRRTVYLPLRRANLPSLLNLFDFGDATSVAGKRVSTTIAPQALFILNSDFVAERARNLASQAAGRGGSPADAVRRLYLRILNRPPSPEETDLALSYLNRFREQFGSTRTESDARMSLSRTLLASNEFIYLE